MTRPDAEIGPSRMHAGLPYGQTMVLVRADD
jgi:hypothetical protein